MNEALVYILKLLSQKTNASNGIAIFFNEDGMHEEQLSEKEKKQIIDPDSSDIKLIYFC